jgi:hypothetical protein
LIKRYVILKIFARSNRSIVSHNILASRKINGRQFGHYFEVLADL